MCLSTATSPSARSVVQNDITRIIAQSPCHGLPNSICTAAAARSAGKVEGTAARSIRQAVADHST